MSKFPKFTRVVSGGRLSSSDLYSIKVNLETFKETHPWVIYHIDGSQSDFKPLYFSNPRLTLIVLDNLRQTVSLKTRLSLMVKYEETGEVFDRSELAFFIRDLDEEVRLSRLSGRLPSSPSGHDDVLGSSLDGDL